MAFDALVVDAAALHHLQGAGDLPSGWTESFYVAPGVTGVSLRVVDNIAFLLSKQAKPDSRLLVIKLGLHGILAQLPDQHRVEALGRALRAGLAAFEPTVETRLLRLAIEPNPIRS